MLGKRFASHKSVLLALVAGLLLAPPAGARPAGPEEPPAVLYRVVLPAEDRYGRTDLARAGIAIDAVGENSITTVVDVAGLARLRRQGLQPLEVVPLDFPPEDAAYHNYDEMQAAIAAFVTAHPDILAVTSIGSTIEGRAIPAVKISDQPEVDDPTEPAVLFMALTHAREHLTVEMALETIRLYAEGYGVDPALTNLVNQREIWVLPDANPDGGEFDVAYGNYLYWRKNLRPNDDGSLGVDLNRNYGYRWGCCDGSSSLPYSETYRGPAPFSEPETQAVRDFVLAHTNIKAAISFHTYGELILYPYGYTYDDTPPDMDPVDHQAFVALAQRMANTNEYSPAQASDLYVTSGDTADWLYGERGIFAFTFEMYPVSGIPGFYPPGAVIGRETERNREAVIYLTTVADSPRKVVAGDGDIQPPSISITADPHERLQVGQPLILSAAADDDTGVTLVSWQADGQTIAMQESPPFALDWAAATPGVHVLWAAAYDAAGNWNSSEPLAVTVWTATFLPLAQARP